jgi:peptide/nickel transport system substrate-binding protein
MTRIPLRILAALLLVAASILVAACGGDDTESGGSGQSGDSAQEGTPAKGKQGGKLTQLSASDVDYLDPGHTYYQFGFEVQQAAHRTLYGFFPGDVENVKPDLAEGEPQISEDKKTLTVKIRPNIKFAPPVNRVITSKDVKYAIERSFTENVGGQYTGYFSSIEGAPKEPSKPGTKISGLETPDDQTLVIKLSQPTAVQIAAALVMPITAPVPEEYAEKFDKENPSTYNTHTVASGPYMVRNDAAGKSVGYKAGKSIELVRNPNWDKNSDPRPAYLDEILIRTNASDASVAARQVLQGQNMIHDTNPPANVLAQVVRRNRDQLSTIGAGGFRWFPLNTTIKPLDDINVRKAILAGFDKDAARKARGGEFVGKIGTHFLPPQFPGFEESGGDKGFGQDYMSNPKGDPALAAEYMKKAGYASGKYEGDDELLMVTSNADPGKAQAEVARDQLEKLGFKIKFRTVPQDAVYTEWCQVPAKKVAICGSAGWFQDYKDPQAMLEVTFKGSEIAKDGGNNNLPQLDVPAIDEAMEKANLLEGEERNKAWAQVNKMIVDQAPAIPFVWDNTNIVHSKNVIAPQNPYNTLFDYSFTSIK